MSKISTVFMARLAVLLLLVVSVVRLPAAEAFDPTTEFQRLPLGIDCPAPRFSWNMAASTNAMGQPVRGQAQTAYRILVASTPDKLSEGGADVRDSGRVTASDSVLIHWNPASLPSMTRYHWTVKIWDQDGVAGKHAPPVWFETSLLRQDDWMRNGAAWIESPLEPEANENMKTWLKPAVVPFDHLEIGGTAPRPRDLIKSRSKLDEMFEQGGAVFQETTFPVPAGFGKGQKIELNLGHVGVTAKVLLNGKESDTLWMPPFALDVTEVLKTGDNKLKVLVTSTSQGKPKLGDVKLRTVFLENVK